MNRIKISDTEYRWYASVEWAAIDGEIARAVHDGEQWAASFYEYGQDRELKPIVSHTTFPELDGVAVWVGEMVEEVSGRLARIDARIKAAEQAEEARQREIAMAGDATLRFLMAGLDQAKNEAFARSVSHPSYGISGARTRDEARIAGIEIQIENRKAELAKAKVA